MHLFRSVHNIVISQFNVILHVDTFHLWLWFIIMAKSDFPPKPLFPWSTSACVRKELWWILNNSLLNIQKINTQIFLKDVFKKFCWIFFVNKRWIRDFSLINIRNRLQFSKYIYNILYHTPKSWYVQSFTPSPVHYPQKRELLNYAPFF